MTDTNKASARQFALDLDKIGKQIPATALAVQKSLALKGLRGLVQKAPVDTGAFRGNFQIVIGSGDAAPIARKDAGARGTDPSGASLAAEEAKLATAQPFGVVSIVNALPYAERLEKGWSQQAPSGVFALTAAELQAEITRAVEP